MADIETLHRRVCRALRAVPGIYSSGLRLDGVPATDLCGAQALIASGVEREVRDCLNRLRHIWDPDGDYADCEFVRFPESFPDVRLMRDGEPIIGVELKTWYLLAKEGEPTCRFKASVNACSDADILCIYPWCWSEVIVGSPRLFTPWIARAREVAEIRNDAWDGKVHIARTTPYPPARSRCCDTPVLNPESTSWGRVARIPGLMRDWVDATLETQLSGIPARYWLAFLSLFKEAAQASAIKRGLERISRDVGSDVIPVGDGDLSEISDHLFAIVRLIRD